MKTLLLTLIFLLPMVAAAAPQNLTCTLNEHTIVADPESGIIVTETLLVKQTAVIKDRLALVKETTDRFYLEINFDAGSLRVFLRDKKNRTALTTRTQLIDHADFFLSDPGVYTEPGLALTCELN